MNVSEATLLGQHKAEQLFAAAAFQSPEYALEKCAWVTPEMFTDERIARFWNNLKGQYKGNAAGAAMEAQCFSDLLKWTTEMPSAYYIEAYANEIQRRTYLVGTDKAIAALVEARQRHDVEGLRNAVAALYNNTPVESGKIPDAVDLALEFATWMNSESKSVYTGIPQLDDALCGLDRKALTILAARPSLGKTTMTGQIARNVAVQRKKAMVFTNEMSTLAWWRKVVCGIAEVDYRDIKANRLTQEKKDHLCKISMDQAEVYGDYLRVDDRSHHTVETIWQAAASIKPDLVIVDILARVKCPIERMVERLGYIAYGLRDMGREVDCHVLLTHHVKREVDTDKRRPGLSDLRESGELEQAADNVMFLHSEALYTMRTLPEKIPVELWVDKQREGKRNIEIDLQYNFKTQWFEKRGE